MGEGSAQNVMKTTSNMRDAKYIMIDGSMPVVFGDYIQHAALAVTGKQVTSAGFVRWNRAGEVITYGESKSLKLRPEDGDDAILRRLLIPEL